MNNKRGNTTASWTQVINIENKGLINLQNRNTKLLLQNLATVFWIIGRKREQAKKHSAISTMERRGSDSGL